MLLKKTKDLITLLIILSGGLQLNAQQWTQMADFPGEGRHRATAISIGNKGYLGFGHINGTGTETIFNDWWEYDPSNNSWTQKASCPIQSMPFSNYTMLDSQGFVIDGVAYLGSSNNGPFLSYNSFTNAWIELNTPSAGMGWTAPAAYDGKGFVFLGSSTLLEYTPQTDSWSNYSVFSTPVSTEIGGWQCVHSVESKMYFTAYDQYGDTHYWVFDLADTSWSNLGIAPHPSGIYPTYFDHQELIIVACGGSSGPWAFDEVYAFDPATGIWMQMEDFTGAGRRYSSSFTLNGQGYICTGTNGVNMSDLWRMNNILGTDDLTNELAVNVFPNPAVEHITIALEEHTSFKVELFDSSGKSVGSFQTNIGEITIERGDLPSGGYHYVVETDNGSRTSGKFLFN